jgi:glycosyltransferase involved in cell wall biosynthesis
MIIVFCLLQFTLRVGQPTKHRRTAMLPHLPEDDVSVVLEEKAVLSHIIDNAVRDVPKETPQQLMNGSTMCVGIPLRHEGHVDAVFINQLRASIHIADAPKTIVYVTIRGPGPTHEAIGLMHGLMNTSNIAPPGASTLREVTALQHDMLPGNATLGDMINKMLARFTEDAMVPCTYVMLLEPSRVPMKHTFLSTMIRDLKSTGAVAVSCTTYRSQAAGVKELPTIFDRGFNVSLGQSSGKTRPTMSRACFGMTRRDARSREASSVQFLSPYCLAINWKTLSTRTRSTSAAKHRHRQRLQIPAKIASEVTLVDTLLQGSSSGVETIRSVEILHIRQQVLSNELARISVMALKQLPDSGRQTVRQAFNTVLESQRLLKDLHGEHWISHNFSIINPATAQADEALLLKCRDHGASIIASIECMNRHTSTQFQTAHRWMWYKSTTPPEEHVGWSLSMVIRDMIGGTNPSMLLIASEAECLMNVHNLPNAVKPYLTSTTLPLTTKVLDIASYAMMPTDLFWLEHRVLLEQMFPHAFIVGAYGVNMSDPNRHITENTAVMAAPAINALNSLDRAGDVALPHIRVVWDAFCCHCCGFSNEMVHLLHPLQKRMDVRTPLRLDCFCSGFTTGIEDSLDRIFMRNDDFPIERMTPHEITVWISHTEPTRYSNEIFRHRYPDYLVGRSMYEFTKIEKRWVAPLAYECDEVWVPATFVANAFVNSDVDPKKIVVIPEAIDTYFYDPTAHDPVPLPPPTASTWAHFCNRPADANTPNHYKFFSNFKWESRKGWETLFTAYFTEFTSSDPVSLYILTHIWTNGEKETYSTKHNQTRLREKLTNLTRRLGYSDELSQHPHFCIIADDLKEAEVAQLYRSTDSFVLPTKGEGWGLPTMQAMSMGKPVISTAWGGQADFMFANNSFMISVERLEEVPKYSEYNWDSGKMWAVPSLTDTKRLMRLVYTDRGLAAERGAAARLHVTTYYSEEAVADIVEARLHKIRQIVVDRRKSGYVLRTLAPKTVKPKPTQKVRFHLGSIERT